MKKKITHRVLCFVGVLGTLLLLSNCRILQKDLSRDKIEFNQETNSDLKSEGFETVNTEFNQETKSNYDFSNVRLTDFIRLNYQPLFDSNGNIIPLIFRHTIDGKSEEIFLSGGNLNQEKQSSSDIKKESISNENTIQSKTEKKFLIHTTYKSLYRIKIKEIKEIKSVWGWDLNFWTGLTIFLQLLIFGIVIYKLPKNSLKLLWDRIWKKKSSDNLK